MSEAVGARTPTKEYYEAVLALRLRRARNAEEARRRERTGEGRSQPGYADYWAMLPVLYVKEYIARFKAGPIIEGPRRRRRASRTALSTSPTRPGPVLF